MTNEFTINTTVYVDAEVEEEVVERLADHLEYKLGLDKVSYTGSKEKGYEIEARQTTTITVYSSMDRFDTDEWSYGDYATENDFNREIENFEKEIGMDLDASACSDF